MVYWASLALIALSFAVQFTSPLRFGEFHIRRTRDTNPDWVEKILRDTATWEPIIVKCANETNTNTSHTNLDLLNMSDLGPLDEYSDLPPRILDWIQADTKGICGHSCDLPKHPMNYTDVSERTIVKKAKKSHVGFMEIEYPSTTGVCKPLSVKLDNRGLIHTCKFENLYIFNGSYVAHIVEGEHHFPQLDTRVMVASGGNPRPLHDIIGIYTHKSYDALQLSIHALGHSLKTFEGLTLAYQPLWHFNIGHALYDGLYPAFVSAIAWSRYREPFHVLLMGGRRAANVEKMLPGAFKRNEKVLELITGKSLIHNQELADLPEYYLTKFDTIIMGMGPNGQKLDVNANFSLGSSRAAGAAHLFRSYIFNSFQIQPRASPGDTLQGVIIHNRRWGTTMPLWVGQVVPNVRRADHINMHYIFWGTASVHDKRTTPSPPTDTFALQMRLLAKTDIYLSSPGTAIMYQHFLPDGGVVINMGEDDSIPRHFMEEYMSEGAPYIRALYYWPVGFGAPIYAQERVDEGKADYDARQVIWLISEAGKLVRSGFEIPVPVNVNLSPVSKVLKVYEYLTQNKTEIENGRPLRALSPRFEAFQTNWFGNHFPHEFLRVGERPEGLNSCLLRALVEDFGNPCPDCFWGFP